MFIKKNNKKYHSVGGKYPLSHNSYIKNKLTKKDRHNEQNNHKQTNNYKTKNKQGKKLDLNTIPN